MEEQRQGSYYRCHERHVDDLACQFGRDRGEQRREWAQENAVHVTVTDAVTYRPIRLRVGQLIDEDEEQVIRDKLALGQSLNWFSARGGRPDKERDEWRDHPAKGKQKEEAAVLQPRHPGTFDERPAAMKVHSTPP